MATVIKHGTQKTETGAIPTKILAILPERLGEELRCAEKRCGRIEELRLRCERQCALSTAKGTVPLSYILSRWEMDELVLRLCGGSLYAHRDSIAKGFLSLEGGIRVGICGRASLEGDRIVGIYDVDGLNLRFPCGLLPVGEKICRLLKSKGGVLIYAPPGEGKTTLLRSVAARMSRGSDGWRVAVVDSRGELFGGLSDSDLSLDVLTGYPRALGIEIALRTMNPQLIVCDEIGEESEAESILRAQHAGVPFLASAHGDHPTGLLRRKSICSLHRAEVFAVYAGIRRRRDEVEYEYDLWEWEVADGLLKEHGGDLAPC